MDEPPVKHDVFHAVQRAGIPGGPVMDEADRRPTRTSTSGASSSCSSTAAPGPTSIPAPTSISSGTPPQSGAPAPVIGQDNDYVYRDVLGVSDDEYEQLERDGHIGTTFA